MTRASYRRLLLRLLPVALVCAAAAAWFAAVQEGGEWTLRNMLPPGLLVVLSALALQRGNGYWGGGKANADWRMPLGVVGFAVPSLGLSAYLHYAYSVNLDGMFDVGPGELFRFLPFYTVVAGSIGFAIGWIAGRGGV